MNNWTSFLENRFVLCVGCGAVTSALVWFGKIGDGVYSAIILGTVGAYIVGVGYDRKQDTKALVEGPK